MAAAQSVLAVVLLFTVCGAAPDDIITTVCRFFICRESQSKPESLNKVLYVFSIFRTLTKMCVAF